MCQMQGINAKESRIHKFSRFLSWSQNLWAFCFTIQHFCMTGRGAVEYKNKLRGKKEKVRCLTWVSMVEWAGQLFTVVLLRLSVVSKIALPATIACQKYKCQAWIGKFENIFRKFLNIFPLLFYLVYDFHLSLFLPPAQQRFCDMSLPLAWPYCASRSTKEVENKRWPHFLFSHVS